MKYDLTRCNNLRWRCGDRIGFIKTDGKLVRVLADELWLSEHGETLHYCVESFNAERAEEWLNGHPEFEIIPRDPKTYKDWQVGDVMTSSDYEECKIAARISNIVIVSYKSRDNRYSIADNAWYTCEELFEADFRLVLTDYEKEIAEAAKKPECPFKKGDRVLVRHGDDFPWTMRFFHEFRPNDRYRYWIFAAGAYAYEQCIPYNEKTWKLLGTTENYVEE